MFFLSTAISGLVKPSGGLDLLAAIFGVFAILLLASFIYFGSNDPTTSSQPSQKDIKPSPAIKNQPKRNNLGFFGRR